MKISQKEGENALLQLPIYLNFQLVSKKNDSKAKKNLRNCPSSNARWGGGGLSIKGCPTIQRAKSSVHLSFASPLLQEHKVFLHNSFKAISSFLVIGQLFFCLALIFHTLRLRLGTGQVTKTDEFLENFQRGGGHFQSKNLYCRFWTFKTRCQI